MVVVFVVAAVPSGSDEAGVSSSSIAAADPFWTKAWSDSSESETRFIVMELVGEIVVALASQHFWLRTSSLGLGFWRRVEAAVAGAVTEIDNVFPVSFSEFGGVFMVGGSRQAGVILSNADKL